MEGLKNIFKDGTHVMAVGSFQAARWGVTRKMEKKLDTTQAILETENSSIRSSQNFVSQHEKYCYMDMNLFPSVPFCSLLFLMQGTRGHIF